MMMLWPHRRSIFASGSPRSTWRGFWVIVTFVAWCALPWIPSSDGLIHSPDPKSRLVGFGLWAVVGLASLIVAWSKPGRVEKSPSDRAGIPTEANKKKASCT